MSKFSGTGNAFGFYLRPGAYAPVRKTEESAGLDLCAPAGMASRIVRPGDIAIIDTGVILDIPEGWEVQVRSRSGLSTRGIVVANAPGTIDADYTDTIKIILANLGTELYVLTAGERIAQIVPKRLDPCTFIQIGEPPAQRGNRFGGLGSTGTN